MSKASQAEQELWVVLRTAGVLRDAMALRAFGTPSVTRRYSDADPFVNVPLADGPPSEVWPRVEALLEKGRLELAAELAGPGKRGSVDVGTTLGPDDIMRSVTVPPRVLAICGALGLDLVVSVYAAED